MSEIYAIEGSPGKCDNARRARHIAQLIRSLGSGSPLDRMVALAMLGHSLEDYGTDFHDLGDLVQRHGDELFEIDHD
jgi:hypothetical protein